MPPLCGGVTEGDGIVFFFGKKIIVKVSVMELLPFSWELCFLEGGRVGCFGYR